MPRPRRRTAWWIAAALIAVGGAGVAWLVFGGAPGPVEGPGAVKLVERGGPGREVTLPTAAQPPDRPPPPAPASTAPPRLGALSARVVTPDRRALSGARVEAFVGAALGDPHLGTARPLARRAVTAADGTFTLDELPPGDALVLRIDGEGFALTERGPFHVAAGETARLGDLPVELGTTLRGSVVDPLGRGVAGARVTLFHQLDAPGDEARAERVVLSDAQGLFSFPNARSDRWTLFVDAEGYARARAAGVPEPGAAPPTELLVRIALEQVHPLRGRVLGMPGEVPLGGARLHVKSLDEQLASLRAVADADGRFEIGNVAWGNYEVHAEADGYSAAHERTWTKYGYEELTIRLARQGGLSGRVLTADGRPATHFDVQLRQHKGRLDAPTPQGAFRRVVSADGAFAFEGLDPGHWCVEVWAQGHVLTESACVKLKQGQFVDGLSVTLQLAASLQGTVVDDAGRVVPGARITLHPNHEPALEMLRDTDDSPVRRQSALSDAQGRFLLGELAARTHQVAVDHPDHALLLRNDVRIVAGETLDLGTLVLERSCTVEGRALDAAGVPLPGTLVSLYRVGDITRQALTDGQGRYVFSRVRSGDYQLSCVGKNANLFAQLQQLNAGMAPEVFTLRPGDRVTRNVVPLP